MKTIFQMGLPRNNSMFWMGQAAPKPGTEIDRVDICAKLATAMDQYGAATGLANLNPNYREVLGADADRFDGMLKDVTQIYDEVLDTEGKLCRGGGMEQIGSDHLINVQSFIAVSAELAKIVQAHSAKSATPAAKPSVPTPSSGPSPLLIGGIAAAGLAVVALVLKG